MKKFVSVLLAFLLLLSFAACQQNLGGTEATIGSFTKTPETMPESPEATPSGAATASGTTAADTTTATPENTTEATAPSVSTSVATHPQQSTQQPTQQQVPTATPMATPTPVHTQQVQQTQPQTQPQTATTKPTQKPTAKPTIKPEVTYTPVSGIAIPNDAVKAAITLDGKVPQNIKEAYNTLKNALSKENVSDSGKKRVSFSSGISVQTLKDAIYYVQNYNPQLFYVDWGHYSYSTSGKSGKVVSVTLTCTDAINQVEEAEAVANQIVTEANKKPNLFERELYVHDWLVKNISYTTKTENCANIYGALVEGKALCEGYSRAFQYLMHKIGIETVLITGSAGGPHMWNMVKLYGDYYFVDVTHDDPLPDADIPDGKEYLIGHSCFNVPAKVLEKTHTIESKGTYDEAGHLYNADLQSCTATTYGYYYVKGLAVDNLEEMQSVLYANKSLQTVEVFFTGSMPAVDDILAAVKAFFKENYPGKGYNYAYTSPDSDSYKRNCIRISWTIK